jgi:hypothetical protein
MWMSFKKVGWCCLLIGIGGIFSISFAALPAVKPVPMVGGFDQQTFDKEIDKQMDEVKKWQEEQNQKSKAGTEKNLTQTAQSPSAASASAATAGKSSSAESKTPPSCDCYDIHSSSTYESNFLYNDKNIRIKRIDPPCQCLEPSEQEKQALAKTQEEKSSASSHPSVANATSATKTAAAEGSADSSWNIHY